MPIKKTKDKIEVDNSSEKILFLTPNSTKNFTRYHVVPIGSCSVQGQLRDWNA